MNPSPKNHIGNEGIDEYLFLEPFIYIMEPSLLWLKT